MRVHTHTHTHKHKHTHMCAHTHTHTHTHTTPRHTLLLHVVGLFACVVHIILPSSFIPHHSVTHHLHPHSHPHFSPLSITLPSPSIRSTACHWTTVVLTRAVCLVCSQPIPCVGGAPLRGAACPQTAAARPACSPVTTTLPAVL